MGLDIDNYDPEVAIEASIQRRIKSSRQFCLAAFYMLKKTLEKNRWLTTKELDRFLGLPGNARAYIILKEFEVAGYVKTFPSKTREIGFAIDEAAIKQSEKIILEACEKHGFKVKRR